jgi:hypothetical protein
MFTVHEQLTLPEMFTAREVELIERLHEFCSAGQGCFARDVRAALARGFKQLGSLATALRAYPSLRHRDTLGGRQRSEATLMRKLLRAGDHGLEWTLPTKAVLSRTFGIAKVNFWTSMHYALQACDADEAGDLPGEVQLAIEEAVYTRLAEELYSSFVTSRTMNPKVKRLAIAQIIDIWEGRVSFATDRFCPILRSAWAARCRTPRVFGTLMGASEIATLLFQDCDAQFVEWFTRQDHESDQVQAFEEFVFDLPFESIESVRVRMKQEGVNAVGPDEVARYLGFPKGKMNPLIEDPKALYSSFRNRRVKAQYRTSLHMPGPKRTAESYVLEGLLLAGAEGEASEPETEDEA